MSDVHLEQPSWGESGVEVVKVPEESGLALLRALATTHIAGRTGGPLVMNSSPDVLSIALPVVVAELRRQRDVMRDEADRVDTDAASEALEEAATILNRRANLLEGSLL